MNNIHSEIIKTFDFKDITKEYLLDRIITLIINEKIGNKKNNNRNLDSYPVTDDAKEIDYNLLHIHHHEKILNTPVNNITTSPSPHHKLNNFFK